MKRSIKNSLWLLLFLSIFFLSTPLLAQNSEWEAFTATTEVHAVLDDGDYLWLGTDGGLVHFKKDHGVVERFTSLDFWLPTSDVTCLARDQQNRIWIGTRNGAARYDGVTFQSFPYKNDGLSLPIEWIRDIKCDPSGNVWFAGGQVLGPLDPFYFGPTIACFQQDGNWKTYSAPANSWIGGSQIGTSLLINAGNSVFCGTDEGLLYLDNGVLSDIPLKEHDPEAFTFWINALKFDTENLTLWVAADDGLYSVKFPFVSQPIKGIHIKDFVIENPNLLWLATGSNGVVCYTQGNYQQVPQLSSINASCVIIAQDNVKWFGHNNGITKYSETVCETYNVGTGLRSNYVRGINADSKDTIWYITADNQLGSFDGKEWSYEQGIHEYFSKLFVDSQDRVWIVKRWGEGPLYHYLNHKRMSLKAVSQVHAMTEDEEGYLWFGGLQQLFRVNADLREEIDLTSHISSLSQQSITALLVDKQKNTLWIGWEYDGIAQMDLSNYSCIKWDSFNSILPYSDVSEIRRHPDGTIWAAFGTYGGGGVYFYKDDVWQGGPISAWGNGTGSDYVNDLEIDAAGNVWFSMFGGMTFWWARGLGLFDGSTWANFLTENSGLVNDNVTNIAVDNDGNKWMSTAGGGICVYRGNGKATRIQKPKLFPSSSRLFSVYPNPFNQNTRISFSLNENDRLKAKRLNIYNSLGQLVAHQDLSRFAEGEHSILFDGKDAGGAELPSGIYLFQLMIGSYLQTLHATLVKLKYYPLCKTKP